MTGFAADWLARREVYDARARSRALATALAKALPANPRLIDLGAGAGSLMRWLAPILARRQRWTLLDDDPALLGVAIERSAGWALKQGWAVKPIGKGAISIAAPAGAIEVHTLRRGLTAKLPLAGQDAVLCSALMDLAGQAWCRRFVASVAKAGLPALLCLTVDGRLAWRPPHRADRLVDDAFHRHMTRDKGLGPALGPDAAQALGALFADAGYKIRMGKSDWRIPRNDAAMLADMIGGHAGAAEEAWPAGAPTIARWAARRRAQALGRRLTLMVGHLDLLALPPAGR
ncbi:MAG: class I SAM-dependent methyltransferase [Alphaproteobacteria bacterium]|nr:class I SAM-dependent methyltransferase [Alphaproteobacteria bacterium]